MAIATASQPFCSKLLQRAPVENFLSQLSSSALKGYRRSLNPAVAQSLIIAGFRMAWCQEEEHDDERNQDPDEAPETPLDEPTPLPVQDPPPQPDQKGPYVVRAR
jgi:hypothetical protein